MKSKKIKKSMATIVSATFLAGILNVPVFASTNIAVSLGYDLSKTEKNQMLKEFGVSENDENIKIIDITVDDIREQLGLGPATSSSSKGNSYSSSYVKLEDSGYGIKVSTNNLTEVTGTMLQNALLTSGITDANCKASSPFPVTGTAALAGILKGFEDVTGEELSLNQKEVAKEEISVTNTLSNAIKEDGEALGKDEAALVINEIKTQVIKDSPKTDIAIDRIVTNIVNNYNITLTPDEKTDVVTLMSNINDIGFNYSDMKNSLKQMASSLKESLEESGKKLNESGFLEKTWNNIKNLSSATWDKICYVGNRAKALVVGIDNIIIEKDGVQYDLYGNILNQVDTPKEDNENSVTNKTEDNITKDNDEITISHDIPNNSSDSDITTSNSIEIKDNTSNEKNNNSDNTLNTSSNNGDNSLSNKKDNN